MANCNWSNIIFM